LSWPHTILFFEKCSGIGERGSLTVRIALRYRLSAARKGSRHVPNQKIVSCHFAGQSPHDDKASFTQEGSCFNGNRIA
jgi:hypothetical protein